jgi:hypothetical protein
MDIIIKIQVIISSHLHPNLPIGLLPSSLPTKMLSTQQLSTAQGRCYHVMINAIHMITYGQWNDQKVHYVNGGGGD